MSNPVDKSNPNRTPQTIDIIPNRPAGLGGFSAPRYNDTSQTYQDIFREAFTHCVNGFENNASGLGGLGSPAAPGSVPFSNIYDANAPAYDDTVIAIHHSKKGIRLVLQANHKAFLVIAVIFLVLISKPGITDVLGAVLKSITGH